MKSPPSAMLKWFKLRVWGPWCPLQSPTARGVLGGGSDVMVVVAASVPMVDATSTPMADVVSMPMPCPGRD